MQLGRTVFSIIVWGVLGCGDVTTLQDQFHKSEFAMPLDERLRIEAAAPIIVLGNVLEVVSIGKPRRSSVEPRIMTQLTKIKIDIEHAIKGGVRSNSLDFYYFTYSPKNHLELGIPTYIPEVGHRRIYFLKPWKDVYRAVGDVTNYSLPVRSGTHANDFCRGKEAGCCIAELLLVPADGLDVDWFLRDLGSSAYAAGTLCSPVKAKELLKGLMKHSNARIAEEAKDVGQVAGQWWPRN